MSIYVDNVFVWKCTCMGMLVMVAGVGWGWGGVACNKVHLATELSSGAPGVSVAHVTHTHTH